jgi:syntaxin-binding protein 5
VPGLPIVHPPIIRQFSPPLQTPQPLTPFPQQYITPSDLDLLIGGPNRPPSKRMLAQARADTMQQRAAAAPSSSRTAALASEQDQGYWQYMQRQLSERTEKLGSVNDGMNSLEQTTGNWLGDVNKFVSQQKKNAVTGSKLIFPVFPFLFLGTCANVFFSF